MNLIELAGKTISDANALPVSKLVSGVPFAGRYPFGRICSGRWPGWVNSVDGKRGVGGTFKAGSPETS